MTVDQWIALFAGIVGGALRVGVPFLFVSLGECLTEKSGRINLGLEGVLVLSAMAAFGGAYWSGSPWIGVLVAATAGALLAALHGVLCSLPRVNDVATGIALMLLGTGLAFYLGKPLIQPQAPQLPSIPLGNWSDIASVRAALQVNALLPVGVALAVLLWWGFARTRAGLLVRMAGDSATAARALGYSVIGHPDRGHGGGRGHRRARRRVADAVLPRQLERRHLERPGPDRRGAGDLRPLEPACAASAPPLLFGGAGAIGPALQSVGIGWGYYLFNTVPYVLTLLILVLTCKPGSVAVGSPGELSR